MAFHDPHHHEPLSTDHDRPVSRLGIELGELAFLALFLVAMIWFAGLML